MIFVRFAVAISEEPIGVSGFESQYEIAVGRTFASENKELSPLTCVIYRKSNFKKGYVDIEITTIDTLDVLGKIIYKLRKKDSETWFLEENGKAGPALIMKSLDRYSGFKYNKAFGPDYTILRDFSLQKDQSSSILVRHVFKDSSQNLRIEYTGKIVSKEAYDKELKRMLRKSTEASKRKKP